MKGDFLMMANHYYFELYKFSQALQRYLLVKNFFQNEKSKSKAFDVRNINAVSYSSDGKYILFGPFVHNSGEINLFLRD